MHVKVKLQICMSMLEWRTTTTDTEVTKGRQLYKMITTTSTKNKEQRTMKDFATFLETSTTMSKLRR